ncbi:unnamed protein product [Schistosoma turkestanicum]|nr:unnamed protein product [Schistosoma turkestanicum]
MSLPYSQGHLTLKEYLSLHSSETSNRPLHSLRNNNNNNHVSTEPTLDLKHKTFPTSMNNNSFIDRIINKPEVNPITQPINNLSTTTTFNRRTATNFTNRQHQHQQLKRSNTVGATDIIKTMNEKILVDYLTNKFSNNNYTTNINNSSNNNSNKVFDEKLPQPRLFQRAQSERPIRNASIGNHNHNSNLPPYPLNNERSSSSSTFRSVFSQRGYNFARSFWQENFTPDLYDKKSSLGSSDIGRFTAIKQLLDRNRLKNGQLTLDDNIMIDTKRLLSLGNSVSRNPYVNKSSVTNGSSISSSSSSSILNHPTLTTHSNTTASSLPTGLATLINLQRLSSNNNQNITKEIWSEKFVEEFLKKSSLLTNNLVNNQNDCVSIASSFTGQTLVQWFCRHIIQSGCPWSHDLISVVCQFCNCLLQLGVLKRDLKSKQPINSTLIDHKLFHSTDNNSDRNSSNTTTSATTTTNTTNTNTIEIFELNMNYVWTGRCDNNEQGHAMDNTVSISNDQLQTNQNEHQHIDEFKQFQMIIYDHLISLQKEFEYELNRITREHELQLFKVKNQGVMKVCQLTDRIEALENQVEKYRILAGIEHLTKSSTIFDDSSSSSSLIHKNNSTQNVYSSLLSPNKNHLTTKVKFNLSNEKLLLNNLPRKMRAFSETHDLRTTTHHHLAQSNPIETNHYNKPDYVTSNRLFLSSNDMEQLPTVNCRREQQKEPQPPQHSRSDFNMLHKKDELSLLKNSTAKNESLKMYEKENVLKTNYTDVDYQSRDNDNISYQGYNKTMVDNANKMNEFSKFNVQHDNPINTTLSLNDENNMNQIDQKVDLKNLTSRFLSVPPYSKFNSDPTNSMFNNNQSVVGSQTKYDINNRYNTVKTSMKGDDSSMSSMAMAMATTTTTGTTPGSMIIKGMKDIKRINKNKGLT